VPHVILFSLAAGFVQEFLERAGGLEPAPYLLPRTDSVWQAQSLLFAAVAVLLGERLVGKAYLIEHVLGIGPRKLDFHGAEHLAQER